MAGWEANEEMYGPGGGDFTDELGNVTPDPYGALAPAAPPAAPVISPMMDPVTGLPANMQLSVVQPDKNQGVAAAAAGAPALAPPDLRPGQGNAAPVEPPDLTPGQGNQPPPGPAMVPVTQTSSSTSTSTSGLDPKSAANIRGAGQSANEAADEVGRVEANNLDAQAGQMRSTAQADYSRGVQSYYQQWGQLQTQEEIASETDRRLQEAAKFKPDRTALFRGDTGLLFGISAAVAAMAGGWLMGQGLTGGKNPYLDTIMQMIDDDARDQISSNSATMQELTRIYGDAKAAGKDLKARMLQSVNDTIAAQNKFQDADQVQRGSAVVMARVEAEKAKNDMETAKLTANTVTKQHQTQSQTSMVANPALTQGFDLNNPKVVETVGKVGALENLLSEANSLAGNKSLEGSVGFLDKKIDAVKGWFDANSVPEQRVAALRAKWELVQRANWASEPNGAATQERLSSIAFPQNDAGIPQFLANVREALNTVDPGGRYRAVNRGMGQRPAASETGNRTPVVR